MSCVINDGIREFPHALAYILISGFTSRLQQKKRFLNNKSRLEEQTAKIKVRVISDYDLSILLEWWINEIDYGYESFTIEAPFFGLNRIWNVELTNDLSLLKENRKSNDVLLELKILDDVETVIANNDYEKITTCV
jgi:hypothetical protein